MRIKHQESLAGQHSCCHQKSNRLCKFYLTKYCWSGFIFLGLFLPQAKYRLWCKSNTQVAVSVDLWLWSWNYLLGFGTFSYCRHNCASLSKEQHENFMHLSRIISVDTISLLLNGPICHTNIWRDEAKNIPIPLFFLFKSPEHIRANNFSPIRVNKLVAGCDFSCWPFACHCHWLLTRQNFEVYCWKTIFSNILSVNNHRDWLVVWIQN